MIHTNFVMHNIFDTVPYHYHYSVYTGYWKISAKSIVIEWINVDWFQSRSSDVTIRLANLNKTWSDKPIKAAPKLWSDPHCVCRLSYIDKLNKTTTKSWLKNWSCRVSFNCRTNLYKTAQIPTHIPTYLFTTLKIYFGEYLEVSLDSFM